MSTLHDGAPDAPSFELISRRYGTTRTILAVGEIDLSVVAQLEVAVHQEIGAGPGLVVVDLTAVEFIDSAGVTALLRVHRHALECEVGLAIVPPMPRVQRTFELCGVDALLPFTAPVRVGGGAPRRSGR